MRQGTYVNQYRIFSNEFAYEEYLLSIGTHSLWKTLVFVLRQGVPNFGAKVGAGQRPPFCTNRPLLVGFKGADEGPKDAKMLSHLLGPRLPLLKPTRGGQILQKGGFGLHGPILPTRSMQ